MKTIDEYLDRAKEITGSDYRTAKALQVSRQAVSNYRVRGTMAVEQAVVLANIIEVEPLEVIAACEVAKKPEKAEFWGKWVAAVAILAIAITAKFPSNQAVAETFALTELYIMRICG